MDTLDINQLSERVRRQDCGVLLTGLSQNQAARVRSMLRRGFGMELVSSGSDRGQTWSIFRAPDERGDHYGVEVSTSYMGGGPLEYRVIGSAAYLEGMSHG